MRKSKQVSETFLCDCLAKIAHRIYRKVPTLWYDLLPEEAQLLWPEDHECVSLAALPPGCPPHPVDVLFRVVWRVVLHYPVHVWDVQA